MTLYANSLEASPTRILSAFHRDHPFFTLDGKPVRKSEMTIGQMVTLRYGENNTNAISFSIMKRKEKK